jgi:hypothetical protein
MVTVLERVPERVKARFWQRVDQTGGPDACWPWMLSAGGHGYGQVTWGDGHRPQAELAHRLAFALVVEDLPCGVGIDAPTVDHDKALCTGGKCCNPRHLRKLPNRINAGDNQNAAKTHCPRHHPYDDENTRRRVDSKGRPYRVCRQCERDRTAR